MLTVIINQISVSVACRAKLHRPPRVMPLRELSDKLH